MKLPTPYLAADLPKLRWQRSGDVIYFTHETRGMWQFVRRGNTDWLSEPFVFKVRPFDDENPDKTKMISASAATGTVTLTAHGFTFDAAIVGEQIKLRDGDQRVLQAWRADTGIAFNDVVMYNERVYRNINPAGANTGQYQPVHVEGVRGGRLWFWRCPVGICAA